jgi:hypothetical protein
MYQTASAESGTPDYGAPNFQPNDTIQILEKAASYQQWGCDHQDLLAIGSWIETEQRPTPQLKA